jgi:hypothetical protein
LIFSTCSWQWQPLILHMLEHCVLNFKGGNLNAIVHSMQGGYQPWIWNKLKISTTTSNANSKNKQGNLLPLTALRTMHWSPTAKCTQMELITFQILAGEEVCQVSGQIARRRNSRLWRVVASVEQRQGVRVPHYSVDCRRVVHLHGLWEWHKKLCAHEDAAVPWTSRVLEEIWVVGICCTNE